MKLRFLINKLICFDIIDKIMKYYIIFLFLILPIYSFSQTNEDNFRKETIYLNWKQQYPTINCQPSFFIAVTKTNIYNKSGEELYKIYFYSNSRYCNGSWAGTYLTGINIYINNVLYNKEGKYWIMFKDIYNNTMFSFWSEPNPEIYITWDNIQIN
jgi:hypothetical protein